MHYHLSKILCETHEIGIFQRGQILFTLYLFAGDKIVVFILFLFACEHRLIPQEHSLYVAVYSDLPPSICWSSLQVPDSVTSARLLW